MQRRGTSRRVHRWIRKVMICQRNFASLTLTKKKKKKTGRAGVPKITNVALTLVVSGSRERSKLYGASRRMARARRGRDGPIVARSSAAYRYIGVRAPPADRGIVASTRIAIYTNTYARTDTAGIDGRSTITAQDIYARR